MMDTNIQENNEVVLKLKEKILKLKEELIGVRNWAKLSITFNSSFGARMVGYPSLNQATHPSHLLPTHIQPPNLSNMPPLNYFNAT